MPFSLCLQGKTDIKRITNKKNASTLKTGKQNLQIKTDELIIRGLLTNCSSGFNMISHIMPGKSKGKKMDY